MAINKGKVIAVSSVKGGVGKTTTLLNLAGTYSLMGKKVLIMDLDLYTGAIAPSLNLEITSDIYKLVDDLMNNRFDFVESYVLKYNDNIDVLAAPKDPRYASKIGSKYIKIILARALMKYDVILVDTNHALDEKNLVVLDNSDWALFVINNDMLNLKNMKSLVSIYKDLNKDNYKIILNNSINKNRDYFGNYDIKNIIKADIDYLIPDSFNVKNIDKYTIDGEILLLNKNIRASHKNILKIFDKIAQDLIEEKKVNE